MASKDPSLYKGSDACDLPCDVCQYQNISSQAISYCNVCKGALCRACDKGNRAIKQTRNHQLLTGDQLPSISGGSQVMPSIMTCDKHQLAVQYFCETDNDVFCSTCKLATHRKCDTTEIYTFTGKHNPQKSFDCTQTKLTGLENAYERLYKKRTNVKWFIKEQMQSCLDDLVKVRKNLNECLDNLEDKMKAEIADVESNLNTKIEGHLVIANDTLRQIRETIASLNECGNTGRNEAMFVGLKKTESEITEYETIMRVLESELGDIDISFKPDERLTTTLRDFKSIGSIERFELKQQTLSVLGMTLSDMRSYDVGCRNVQSIIFMPDDHVVLACLHDGLILLDRNYQEMFRLSMRAAFACKVSDTEVLVSLGKNKQIQFIEVSDTLIAKDVLDIWKGCHGVDYSNGEMYVACGDNPGNAEVQVLTRNGELMRRLGVIDGKSIFTEKMLPKVNNSEDKVFISDYGNHTITCLDQQGRVIFNYSSKYLGFPGVVFVDEKDSLMVCGDSTNNVEIIIAGGKKHRTVLKKKNGIQNPLCIVFRQRDGCLAVGTGNKEGKDKPNIVVFKAKLN